MAYEPDWETLPGALAWLARNSIGELEGKSDICGAISDRKIAVRILTAETEDGLTGFPKPGGRAFQGDSVVVPSHLEPADLDWVKSRPHTGDELRELRRQGKLAGPLKPWRVRPTSVGEHYSGIFDPGPWNIALIELWREDLDKLRQESSSTSGAKTPLAQAHIQLRQVGPAAPAIEGESSSESGSNQQSELRRIREPSEPKRSGPRGPQPGTVDRYGESDRALFPEMDRLTAEGKMSVNAAALELVERIDGKGTHDSKARRLAALYRKQRKQQG